MQFSIVNTSKLIGGEMQAILGLIKPSNVTSNKLISSQAPGKWRARSIGLNGRSLVQ
jgi:hypothetical protein